MAAANCRISFSPVGAARTIHRRVDKYVDEGVLVDLN
jgi:hypothetical protein